LTSALSSVTVGYLVCTSVSNVAVVASPDQTSNLFRVPSPHTPLQSWLPGDAVR